MPSEHYSYPLLPPSEILIVLKELNIDAQKDDLDNPVPVKVHAMFWQLIELLLNQRQEDLAQAQFKGLDMLEFPELHDESVPMIGFVTAWCAEAWSTSTWWACSAMTWCARLYLATMALAVASVRTVMATATDNSMAMATAIAMATAVHKGYMQLVCTGPEANLASS